MTRTWKSAEVGCRAIFKRMALGTANGRGSTWALGSSHHTITCLWCMELQDQRLLCYVAAALLWSNPTLSCFLTLPFWNGNMCTMPLYPWSTQLVFLFHNTSQLRALPWISEETLGSKLLNNAGAVKDTMNFGNELIHFVLWYEYNPFEDRIL